MSSEVHCAIRRCYRRFQARRDASRRILRTRNSQSFSSGIVVEHPVQFFRCRSSANRRPQPQSLGSLSVEMVETTSFPSFRGNNGTLQRNARDNQQNGLYPLSPFGMPKTRRYVRGSRNGQHVVCMPGSSDSSLI